MKSLNPFLFGGIIIAVTLLILILLGQPLIAGSGNIYLWSSAGEGDYSQHISDWYSFSHFLHGVIFFILGIYFFKKYSFPTLFLFAIVLESAWEILENSPMIIDRYRQSGIAAGYFGDSVLNSFFDIVFMCLGFRFAKKFGVKVGIITFICLELFTLYFIRDNLTLNIVMLLHPFRFISDWQMGL